MAGLFGLLERELPSVAVFSLKEACAEVRRCAMHDSGFGWWTLASNLNGGFYRYKKGRIRVKGARELLHIRVVMRADAKSPIGFVYAYEIERAV